MATKIRHQKKHTFVCDKPFHKIKENMPLGEELENLWNYPLAKYETSHRKCVKTTGIKETTCDISTAQ